MVLAETIARKIKAHMTEASEILRHSIVVIPHLERDTMLLLRD
jgi:hypothetical protein